jgi:hypothetical protein
MQLLKNIGLFVRDVSVLIFSLVLTLFITAGAEYVWHALAGFSFLACFPASIYLFFRLRKRSYNSKIEHEAARFLAARRSAALHPRRANYFRLVHPCLIWLPSACALLVLFFFPQATHLFHPRLEPEDRSYSVFMFLPRASHLFRPGADRVIHNQASIPWNWTIAYTWVWSDSTSSVYAICPGQASWPFGSKLPWDKTARLCGVTFDSISASSLLEIRNHGNRKYCREQESSVKSTELRSNSITLICRQFHTRSFTKLWKIDCETSSDPQPLNFDAQFIGPEENIPAFYQILQSVSPSH